MFTGGPKKEEIIYCYMFVQSIDETNCSASFVIFLVVNILTSQYTKMLWSGWH